MFDVVSIRKEKHSPASERCERVVRTTMRLFPLTMGIRRTERLVHAPSFSTSASPECSMCAKFHLRFQDLGLLGGRGPSQPELQQKHILEHILYNQLNALTSRSRNAGISMAIAGKPGRSSCILRELDVRSPGDRIEFRVRSLQSSAGGSASGSSEPD